MALLSFTTMGTPEKDAFEAIAAAIEFGYAGVDMRVHEFKGEMHVDSSDQFLADIRRASSDTNIAIPSLLCYNKTGNADDPASWDVMYDDICRHLEIAHKVGAEAIRIFGGPIDKYGDEAAYIEKSAAVLQRVFDSNDNMIDIVLQNHKGSYTFAQGVELAKAMGPGRFGMCFSPDHCCIMQEGWDYALSMAREYSLQMYCSDARWKPDGTSSGALPGEGNVDLPAAYKALGGSDFTGWVSFKWEKIWQDQLDEPEIALPHFIEYFHTQMAK